MAHPRMYDESNELIRRLREICLAFPAAVEKEAWGECTFRVIGGKMFAMTDNDHHQSGHLAVWVMAPPTIQQTLIRSMPQRFFIPPYVGVKGWVGVRLDMNVDWDELAGILRDGYLMSAPAKLPGRKAIVSSEPPGDRQKGRRAQSKTGPAKAPTAGRRNR